MRMATSISDSSSKSPLALDPKSVKPTNWSPRKVSKDAFNPLSVSLLMSSMCRRLDVTPTEGLLKLDRLPGKKSSHFVSKKEPLKAALDRPPAVFIDLVPAYRISKSFFLLPH